MGLRISRKARTWENTSPVGPGKALRSLIPYYEYTSGLADSKTQSGSLNEGTDAKSDIDPESDETSGHDGDDNRCRSDNGGILDFLSEICMGRNSQ